MSAFVTPLLFYKCLCIFLHCPGIGDLCFGDNPDLVGVCQSRQQCQSNQRNQGLGKSLCEFSRGQALICCYDSQQAFTDMTNTDITKYMPASTGLKKQHNLQFPDPHPTSLSRPLNTSKSFETRKDEPLRFPGSGSSSKVVTPTNLGAVANNDLKENVDVKSNVKVGDISAQKCKEYNDVINSKLNISGANSTDVLCAKANETVVGYRTLDPREIPHAALIGYRNPNLGGNINWTCYGTLISENYVVALQNCLFDIGVYASVVRVGGNVTDQREENPEAQIINVTELIKYPPYLSRFSKAMRIVLLKLARPVDMNEFVRPACLNKDPVVPENIFAISWTTSYSNLRENINSDLIKTSMKPVECNPEEDFSDGQVNSMNGTSVCAEMVTPIEGQCTPKGPLLAFNPNTNCMQNLLGFPTSSASCSRFLGDTVFFLNLTRHLDWIEKNVWLY